MELKHDDNLTIVSALSKQSGKLTGAAKYAGDMFFSRVQDKEQGYKAYIVHCITLENERAALNKANKIIPNWLYAQMKETCDKYEAEHPNAYDNKETT